MTSKKNLVIIALIALVVGYGLGDFIGIPGANKEQLSGDISKVDLYSNQMEDPELALTVEQLQSDTAFMNQTKLCIQALKERTSILFDLTNRTVEMCDEVPELQEAMKGMRSLQAKSYNSSLALDQTMKSLEKIERGEKAPEYQQASDNSYTGFMRIENSLDIAKQFVDAAVNFLKDKSGEEFDEMATLTAEWSVYCIEDAVLNDSEEKLAAWMDKVGNVQSLGLSIRNSDAFKDLLNLKKLSLATTRIGEGKAEEKVEATVQNKYGQSITNLLNYKADIFSNQSAVKSIAQNGGLNNTLQNTPIASLNTNKENTGQLNKRVKKTIE